jgi:hypothetical protein
LRPPPISRAVALLWTAALAAVLRPAASVWTWRPPAALGTPPASDMARALADCATTLSASGSRSLIAWT